MRHSAFLLMALLSLTCANVPPNTGLSGGFRPGFLSGLGIQKVLFTDTRESIQHLYVVDNASGEPRRITSAPARRQGAWSPDGRLIAYREIGTDGVSSSLNVVRDDGTGGRQLVSHPGGPSILMFKWSPDGARIAYRVGPSSMSLRIIGVEGSSPVIVEALGAPTSVSTGQVGFAWSPDSRTLAYEARYTGDAATQVYLVNADGTGRRRLTATPTRAGSPAWSPDGRRLGFESGAQIFVINADGTGQRQVVPGPALNPDWSPRGDLLVFQIQTGGLGVVNADGTGQRQIVNSTIGDFGVLRSWSPGGTRVAFLGLSENRGSLFVVAVAGNDFQDLVDDVGSFDIRWTR